LFLAVAPPFIRCSVQLLEQNDQDVDGEHVFVVFSIARSNAPIRHRHGSAGTQDLPPCFRAFTVDNVLR
jgi:hypothetical protein